MTRNEQGYRRALRAVRLRAELRALHADLDARRRALVCGECGRVPLMIEVAGDDGATVGSHCAGFVGLAPCLGRLIAVQPPAPDAGTKEG